MDIDSIKKVKEHAVAGAVDFDGEDDLKPMMEVYRDGRLVSLITAHKVDKEQLLRPLKMIASGFGADRLSMVFDAHQAPTMINPTTGKQWKPGEMQAACETGACDLGLITDCLIISDTYRSGLVAMRMLPYHVHKAAKTVAWAESDAPEVVTNQDGDASVEGYVIDELAAAFMLPDLFEMITGADLSPSDFGLTMANARVQADCAITKELTLQFGLSIMVSGSNEEDMEIIRASFASEADLAVFAVERHP